MNTLIISGGTIFPSFLESYLATYSYDVLIAVDKGLEVIESLHLIHDHIVGDFDSVNTNFLQKYQHNEKVIIHSFNPEKDYTDTDIALNLALDLGSSDIVILGAIGTRLDHTIANIHLLMLALDKQVSCKIVNENNQIQLVNSCMILKKNSYWTYASIIPLTSQVKGITLQGFKYPLFNDTLSIGKSLGISNEILADTAKISITDGILILILSKD